MPECERLVDVVQVEYLCDRCGPVKMEPMEFTGYTIGNSSMSNNPYPRQYQHQCVKGHKQMLGKQYPLMEPREQL